MEKYSFLLKYQCFSLSVYGFKCFAVCAGADCVDVQECQVAFEVYCLHRFSGCMHLQF